MRLKAAYWANIVTYRIYTRALGAVVNYHAVENLPMNGSVCVANHTTILDVITLSNHRPYALIGQSHGGALGWWQKRLARCTKVNYELLERILVKFSTFGLSGQNCAIDKLSQINFGSIVPTVTITRFWFFRKGLAWTIPAFCSSKRSAKNLHTVTYAIVKFREASKRAIVFIQSR